ncbi:hypothetical protein H0H92_011290 [Tricholoma furcatifolium]|nr:hypothetical protein H0H92_011290 [Tricholoma furcatifolium]
MSSTAHYVKYTGPPLASHTHYFWTVRIETTGAPVIQSSEFKTGRAMAPTIAIQTRDAQYPLADAFRSSSWIWTNETNSPDAPAGSFASIRRTGINHADLDTGGDSPAGLLAAIQITYSDGSTSVVTSDSTWRANQVVPYNFQQPSVNDSTWPFAETLGNYGISPWFSGVTVPTPNATQNVLAPVTTSFTTMRSATSSASSTSAPESTPGPSSNRTSAGAVVGAVLGGVVLIGLVVAIILFRKRSFTSKRISSTVPLFRHSDSPMHTIEPFILTPSINTLPMKTPAVTDPNCTSASGSGSSNHERPRQESGGGSYDNPVTRSSSVGSNEASRYRLQRLQDLISELNREVAERGEGGPYVSELRGRIAELVREDSETGLLGSVILPPAYQQ